MSERTDHHNLPLLTAGQAHKEISHNEALIRVDALLHPAVLVRALSTPPDQPQIGQMWIVGASPSGAWTQHLGEIALWQPGGWTFLTPRAGLIAWISSDGAHAVFDGEAWRFDAWPTRSLEIDGKMVVTSRQPQISAPLGGASVDTQARAVLAQVLGALRNHGLIEA